MSHHWQQLSDRTKEMNFFVILFLIFIQDIGNHYMHRTDFRINTTYQTESFKLCTPILERYRHLKSNYFIAINLHNNDKIIPHLLSNILEISNYIGSSHLFISIVESGSDDGTKESLDHMRVFLSLKKINYKIETSPFALEHTNASRIEYLSYFRNEAMNPFYNNELHVNNIDIDSILFINDILFCPNDVFELIYQRRLNNASVVSGLDYWYHNKKCCQFYDTWVAIDTSGRHLRANCNDDLYWNDKDTKNGQMQQLPIQMMSTWNGMAVLNPKPFLEGVRFRKGLNSFKGMIAAPGECSGSECQTLCFDFIKSGYSRIMIVPRVKVAYNIHDYKALAIEFDRNKPFIEEESVKIDWRPFPSQFICQPYLSGHRGRDRSNFEYLEHLPSHVSPIESIN